MSKAIKPDVEKLVTVELEAANVKFPLFTSAHEGYAVLLEEVEELKAEVETVERELEHTWRWIKSSKQGWPTNPLTAIAELESAATAAACEAIQVAAMCRKFREISERVTT